MSLAKELRERGFIHQISGSSLEEIIDGQQRTIYHGIDPSADSAHAGNFVNWMMLRHLAKAGHKIIFLVGGGTGMIGDPKPDAERQLKDVVEVAGNVAKLRAQAEKFFAEYDIEFVDNAEWLGELKLIDFLRDIGKHYTVNELIKKDAIATRLASDTGLSYTEFAYPLLQGYDYLKLFETKGCTVQVGGSDQWGNVVSGVELVRRKMQVEVYAITVPLVVDKTTGKKFGKSEGNAIWLDPEKTSPYQFYQFWLNVDDESAIEHLKRFTFLSLEQIELVKQEFEANPGARLAQKKLAFAVTEIVHGTEAATAAQVVSQVLFEGRSPQTFSDTERRMFLANAPILKVKEGLSLVDVLVETKLAASKREAKTFIESDAVVLAGRKVTDVNQIITTEHFTEGIAFLRRGKKNLYTLTLES
ncbi:MAG: tyrosine--tRNA ligase [Candidatus Pacebacteria bacterium]|nr:tyrosine--tRNA ligase [Candidatus Paceibacterota bacterium]